MGFLVPKGLLELGLGAERRLAARRTSCVVAGRSQSTLNITIKKTMEAVQPTKLKIRSSKANKSGGNENEHDTGTNETAKMMMMMIMILKPASPAA